MIDLARTSWAASRVQSMLALGEAVGGLLGGALPLMVGFAAAAIVAGESGRAWGAGAIVVFIFGAVRLLDGYGLRARLRQFEQVGHRYDLRIAEMMAATQSIEHYFDQKFLDRFAILRQQRGALGLVFNRLLVNLANIVRSLAVLIISATVDWRLLLLAVAAIPHFLVSTRLWAAQGRAEEEAAEGARLSRDLAALAGGEPTRIETAVFKSRAVFQRRVDSAVCNWRRPLVRATRNIELLAIADEIFEGAVAAAVLLLISWSVWHGMTPPATLAVAVMSIQGLRGVVNSYGYAAETIGPSLRTLRRYSELVRTLDEAAVPAQQASTTDSHSETLELRHVSFQYPESTNLALSDVTLELTPGSVVAIVGENGAGKSTLVQILLGLLEPTAGQITGRPARTSAAFQDPYRFELAAIESIRLHRDVTATELDQALERSGADSVIAAVGRNRQLGEKWPNGTSLSGGQWQRLALGRSLLRTGRLLVLDEPAAALDAHAEHELFTKFLEQTRAVGATDGIGVIVTHRFTTVQDADMIIVLDHGRVAAHGTHRQLLREDGLYAELYELQAASHRHHAS